MLDGVIAGIDENLFQRRIADSAYELERTTSTPANASSSACPVSQGNDDDDMDTLRIGNEDETAPAPTPRRRPTGSQPECCRQDPRPARTEAADPEVNLMPTLIEASHAYATLGEIMDTMADVFGRHTEVPVI